MKKGNLEPEVTTRKPVPAKVTINKALGQLNRRSLIDKTPSSFSYPPKGGREGGWVCSLVLLTGDIVSYMYCLFCNCHSTSIILALDMGWIISFWCERRRLRVDEPVCAKCCYNRLELSWSGHTNPALALGFTRTDQHKGKAGTALSGILSL